MEKLVLMDGISGAMRYILRCKRNAGVCLVGDRRGCVVEAMACFVKK